MFSSIPLDFGFDTSCAFWFIEAAKRWMNWGFGSLAQHQKQPGMVEVLTLCPRIKCWWVIGNNTSGIRRFHRPWIRLTNREPKFIRIVMIGGDVDAMGLFPICSILALLCMHLSNGNMSKSELIAVSIALSTLCLKLGTKRRCTKKYDFYRPQNAVLRVCSFWVVNPGLVTQDCPSEQKGTVTDSWVH